MLQKKEDKLGMNQIRPLFFRLGNSLKIETTP